LQQFLINENLKNNIINYISQISTGKFNFQVPACIIQELSSLRKYSQDQDKSVTKEGK
jgi:rRNA-processing protein FCF1